MMEDNKEQNTDAASIRPVSSLRSHFEGLKSRQGSEDAGTVRASPQTLKPTDPTSSVPLTRASLDITRPKSPWTNNENNNQTVQTPVQERTRLESPTRSNQRRPTSMLAQPSPILTPSVKIESPRSPPRHYFDRTPSRSPERIDNAAFSKVRELISQHSSRSSSRAATPRTEGGDSLPDSEGHGNLGSSTAAINERPKSPLRPPPVNRADKPKIAPKPNVIGMPSGISLAPDQRKTSAEARVSPFSTPPSSDDNSSPIQSPESKIIPERLRQNPDIPISKDHREVDQQQSYAEESTIKATDARSAGFTKAAPTIQKRDPRAIGFGSPEKEAPQKEIAVPARANTVSERPAVRDARSFGFSSAKATPRHVSDSHRHMPEPPVISQPLIRPQNFRDPRLFGFSGHTSISETISEEAPPGLPPRRNVDEAPPRPSNESKYAGTRPVKVAAPLQTPDRSTKPPTKTTIVRAATVPVEPYFPPPPKRSNETGEDLNSSSHVSNTSISRSGPIVASANLPSAMLSHDHDSDEAEEPIEPPNTTKTDYPDATQANRRPPFFKTGLDEIHIKSDSRSFDVCGQYLCTTGYVTRVFDMLSGETLMSINHGETVKMQSVSFKPAEELQQEGARLWLGANIGEILEVDVATQSILATNTSHNRREVVQILRNCKDLWTLDDDGKLFVWPANESGMPNLRFSHISHKVQKGHTFSMAVKDKLWLATGKEIRVYRPGNEASFAALTKPLSQHGTGDITSGTWSDQSGGKVYFGHTDGKVTVYSTKDYACIGNIKVSDYKINGLSYVGDKLWAAYKTGKIYVYDTSSMPWKVSKDWPAHDGPVSGVLLDPSSFWTLRRLQVVTLGHDNSVRLWDGMLEEDWMESAMQGRDVEYCTFREVKAAVVSWNVGASTPYDLKSDFIADAMNVEDPPEILAFGFQEVVDLEDRAVTAKSILGFSKKKDPVKTEHHQSRVYREWRDYLSKIIGRYTSARVNYSELHTSSLVGLFQCIFIRQEEKANVRDLCGTDVKCGLKGHYGNKGALVTRFILHDSSLCFINCHLAAGQTHTSHRNNDITTILESKALPAGRDPDDRRTLFIGGGDGSQILDHEMCLLNGDLNYRIDAIPRDTVISMIKRNELSKLMERDQIMVCRKRVSGFRLASFIELPITFAPTYKYDVGTDNYDTSEKKRAPAWCDRLLYRGPGRIKQVEYRRHEVRVSDHRPVSGIFKLRVKTVNTAKRQKIWQECSDQFLEVKRRMAEKASVEYLVNSLGVPEKEARKLIAGG